MIKPGQLRMTDYGTNHTYLVLHQIKDDETYSKTVWSIMLFYKEGDAEELVWYEDDLLQDILLSDSEK